MKITETIERECCATRDLKPYHGQMVGGYPKSSKLWFCPHCGQMHHVMKDEYDNPGMTPLTIAWNSGGER